MTQIIKVSNDDIFRHYEFEFSFHFVDGADGLVIYPYGVKRCAMFAVDRGEQGYEILIDRDYIFIKDLDSLKKVCEKYYDTESIVAVRELLK